MKKRGGIDTIAGLILVCLFAVCLFFALASAAQVYKDITDVMAEQYSTRTAMGYVISKVHQQDALGGVSLGTVGDVPALILNEMIDGEDYATYIYCSNGYIMELFANANEHIGPEGGLEVIAADSLELELEGKLLRVRCVTASGEAEAYVSLRSGGTLYD